MDDDSGETIRDLGMELDPGTVPMRAAEVNVEDGAIEDRLTILDDLSELDIEVSDTDDSKGKS